MKIIEHCRPILTALLALALAACATVEPPDRGKLSRAMEVSSDEYQGTRQLQGPEGPPVTGSDADGEFEAESAEGSSVSAESSGPAEPKRWKRNVMLSSGFGSVLGGDYRKQNGWTIRAGGEDEDGTRSEIFAGVDQVSLHSGSPLHQSIDDDLTILLAGVNLKHFFAPDSQRLRPYASIGAGGAYMFWSYKNPFMTSGGEIVNGDNLTGLLLTTAAGIEFKPVDSVSLVIEANPKLYLWMDRTGRGFDNDTFDPVALIALTAGVSFAF